MNYFHYVGGELCVEDVPLETIAERHGTPTYVYSRAALEANYRAYGEALAEIPHLLCYAVKANANLAVLEVLARLGSGFDIVSGVELSRVQRAGGDPARVVFSGVGKRADELRAALGAGVFCFNVESTAEFRVLCQEADRAGCRAPLSVRINPDVQTDTHPHIATGLAESKFGLDPEAALALYLEAARHKAVKITGIGCHIGSQLTELAPYLNALELLLELVERLAEHGIVLSHLDLGGGFGVRYRDETPLDPAEFAAALAPRLKGRNLRLLLEPGRSIAASAGALLCGVELIKQTPVKDYAVLDAAMNDLLRPALYEAYHEALPVRPRDGTHRRYDLVGPVCESSDFLGRNRELCLRAGDLLALQNAGAYGFAMSSNYNGRNRPAEVLVDGNQFHLVRRRETLEDQLALECGLPE